jgi:hypothetical protein
MLFVPVLDKKGASLLQAGFKASQNTAGGRLAR